MRVYRKFVVTEYHICLRIPNIVSILDYMSNMLKTGLLIKFKCYGNRCHWAREEIPDVYITKLKMLIFFNNLTFYRP